MCFPIHEFNGRLKNILIVSIPFVCNLDGQDYGLHDIINNTQQVIHHFMRVPEVR